PMPVLQLRRSQEGVRRSRHLWPELFRLIAECRPATFFGEQVADAVGFGWFDLVAGDLESAGYAVAAAVFPAAAVGAPHQRDRLYFVADSDRFRHAPRSAEQGPWAPGDGVVAHFWSDAEWLRCPDGKRRAVKPGVRLLADGLPAGMGAL